MQAVILAGGASSRFWPLNTRHKSLLKIQGKTLLRHTLESLQDAGVEDVVIVQGPDRDIAEELSLPEETSVSFAVQEEPKGMGNALEQAQEHVSGRFLVTGPYRIDVGSLLDKLQGAGSGKSGAVAGAATASPEQYGILDLEGENAVGVVEKPGEKAPSDYRVVSTYLLDDAFFEHLEQAEEHQYSFEDALDAYMKENDVGFAELEEAPLSLKYPWHILGFAEDLLGDQQRSISESADISESATVEGNVVIRGGVKIYENAVIRGPCYIGEDCIIGNNAVVRAGTNLEEGSRIGANAEVRGSVIQEGFSMHSGFIGDSVIGRSVSVGAGTVVANRRVRENGQRPTISVHVHSKEERLNTGRDRLGVIAGDEVEIGTQANLMPGVCIGPRTFIGPSAMVRNNVGGDKRYFTKVEGRELER